jgi:hypothetical protein
MDWVGRRGRSVASAAPVAACVGAELVGFGDVVEQLHRTEIRQGPRWGLRGHHIPVERAPLNMAFSRPLDCPAAPA